MEIALVIATGCMCLFSFVIGARVGQRVQRGETIETPTISPLKAYREREARREAKEEQNRIDTIMRNIESYDGTSYGQEDVPGR